MRVKLVGPDDVLPGGYVTADMGSVPRVGETVLLYDEQGGSEEFVVDQVVWPATVHNNVSWHQAAADSPEVAITRQEN